MFPEQIITISQFQEFTYKEKKSNFIAQVYPIENEQSASEILQQVKKTHYKANHHCYALKIIDSTIKYSDDGEPGGTAGIRILNAIDHFDVTNLILIVIRYFGGTKLGVGPLGKAYYEAAFNVLQNSKKMKKTLVKQLKFNSDFSLVNHIQKLLDSYQAKIISSEYLTDVNFNIVVPLRNIDTLKNNLTNISNGKIEVIEENEQFYEIL